MVLGVRYRVRVDGAYRRSEAGLAREEARGEEEGGEQAEGDAAERMEEGGRRTGRGKREERRASVADWIKVLGEGGAGTRLDVDVSVEDVSETRKLTEDGRLVLRQEYGAVCARLLRAWYKISGADGACGGTSG
eukprot:1338580-Rhodomonas_salina.1